MSKSPVKERALHSESDSVQGVPTQENFEDSGNKALMESKKKERETPGRRRAEEKKLNYVHNALLAYDDFYCKVSFLLSTSNMCS